MSTVNPYRCSCCNEIYNQVNLKNIITLGKHTLKFCPECYKEFKKNFVSVSEVVHIANREEK